MAGQPAASRSIPALPFMRRSRPILRFVFILLLIEFLDELIFGLREAAWPLIRTDLGLTYVQIGLLISVPGLIGSLIEPILGILADTWKRRVLILGGGCVFVFSCVLAAGSQGFPALLLAYILFFPASGAYVSLSQAVLMDLEPARHEQNMSRWTFAGSLGVVLGPLLLGGSLLLGGGWREPFWGVAGFAALVLVLSWRAYRGGPAAAHLAEPENRPTFIEGLRGAGQALKRKEVLRWLVLLEFADLMLDVLYSYLALYLVDVANFSPGAAGVGVSILTGVGLLSDFLIIPLLERVPGLSYLRISTLAELVLFPAFLLTPDPLVKIVLLGLIGFFNAGWYSILQGRLYSAMPGQSGTVMTLGNIAGLAWKLVPLFIGLIAQRYGLGTAMWLIWLGPIALLIGLPRR